MKPFIKWVGGKSQIINTIIENFPKMMENYHEIFLGGGSVLLSLLCSIQEKKIEVKQKIYAYDLNQYLINTYKNIQKNPSNVFQEITKITNIFDECDGEEVNRDPETLKEAKTSKESYYYWIRKKYNKLSDDKKNLPTGSAMFIFLNKTCFRGLYRVGKNGFNVPYGHYKNPSIADENELIKISKLIKNVIFETCDFETSLKNIKDGDFAYLDPPYAPVSDKSFVGYNADGFSMAQHQKLFQMCKDLKNKKIKFMMSNAHVPSVIKEFPESKFSVQVIECRRAINSKNPSKKTKEVIIKSF